jgi:ligand-binding sensor domain-containing protein/serine phosphatase RsbU (regulator of sigma subunit)
MHKRIHYHWGFRFIWLLAIAIMATEITLTAQTYFFDNYSTRQEFDSKVYAIVQDKDHYVWLGTPRGVWKFDGKTFVNFSDNNGLAAGSVRALFTDHRNNLWLGHEGGGITRFNGRSFEKIILPDSVIRSNITSINQDKDDNLWITTESDGALIIKNPFDAAGSLRYEHYLKGESLGDQVFSSLITKDGSLFFITNVGIRKYDKKGNSFGIFLPKGLFTYFSISVMFEDSRGDIWFGAYNGGLSKLDHKDNSIRYYRTSEGLASNWITSIAEDREGNIWAGHWKDASNAGGITKIEPSGKIKIYNTSNGLHDDHIWCIVPDHEGNILIGTTDQGLEIFKGEKFISFSSQDGLVHNQVNAVTESRNGEMWFGTNKGISEYKKEGDKTTFHLYDQNSFISNQISFFKKDRNNNIWIGTSDQGVLMYNTPARRFVSQPRINENLNYFGSITAMEITRDGALWIGTIGGLVGYNILNDRYIGTYTQGSGLAGNEITALFCDSKNNLWIGAGKNKGLTVMQKGMIRIVKNVKDITPTCMTEDKNGKIWIGTDASGILVMDKDGIVEEYALAEGLLSKHINLLYCDAHNNIYVGTNLGLNKIDQQHHKVLSYTKRVGFTGIETRPNAWFQDSKGYLWLGTANGAIRCNLELLAVEDSAKPVIHINEMYIKGVLSDMVNGEKLSGSQNDITFNYNSISIGNPEGITYYTLLEGYDDNWQKMGNENARSLIKLPPGRYTFKVKARNESGEWTIHAAEYHFRILAPPYKRGYFIISVICIIIASIIAYIKIRERNLIYEKRILEARVQERTQELQEANTELSIRNKDILDSITYAKRIQLAILPSDIPFSQTFILYKPKDIVSGDFYWMNVAGGKEFMAAVDCTGHGVPGAFMSFIGYTSLNKIIIEQNIYKPSGILNRLNEEVAATLHQKGEAIVNDGMDIALVCYTPETGILEYAGAFNPLVLVRNDELMEIKADRFAIGHSVGKEKFFTNHELKLEKGDNVYLYSDGYADQFGGPDEKKFKTATLKEQLVKISSLSSERKLKSLDTAFEDWKGNCEQIDDVLVMGRTF